VLEGFRDVAPGLWIWRVRYPDWRPEAGWPETVTATCVESRGEVAVIDAIVPSEGADEVWARLDARSPTLAVVLKPDHVRDVDAVVRRYGARAYGPYLFWRLYDGRGRNETPLWLPEQRALVFADALTERGGELRVWGTPWHEQRVLPALRDLLELPFEHVIVSHAEQEPVHTRAEYERALERPPYED
jgi:glyoxylase-like metal-dependent hydrolase (beta-lactamase superfamily II)